MSNPGSKCLLVIIIELNQNNSTKTKKVIQPVSLVLHSLS